MMTRILTATILTSQAQATTNSTPWDTGITGPASWPSQTQPLEHPQAMTTVVEAGAPPALPVNDSTLALGSPQELTPAAPAE